MKMQTKSGKKGRPVNIPQDTMDLLMILTEPEPLDHTAEHSAFIKNAVLLELRAKIIECDRRGSF